MPSSHPGTTAPDTPKKINLALQGGGAHGAFTWGVLDYLLESRKIEGIRVLQGLLSLNTKYSCEAINTACRTAAARSRRSIAASGLSPCD